MSKKTSPPEDGGKKGRKQWKRAEKIPPDIQVEVTSICSRMARRAVIDNFLCKTFDTEFQTESALRVVIYRAFIEHPAGTPMAEHWEINWLSQQAMRLLQHYPSEENCIFVIETLPDTWAADRAATCLRNPARQRGFLGHTDEDYDDPNE